MQALCDNSEEVREATLNVLLPSVLAWAHELDKLQSDLLELFLQQLELTLLVGARVFRDHGILYFLNLEKQYPPISLTTITPPNPQGTCRILRCVVRLW